MIVFPNSPFLGAIAAFEVTVGLRAKHAQTATLATPTVSIPAQTQP